MGFAQNLYKAIGKGIANGLKQGTKAGAELGAEMINQTVETVGNVANETNEVNKNVLEVVGAKPAPNATEQAEKILAKIEDTTQNNIDTPINNNSFNLQDWAKEMQERQWQREDEIRAETQAREDSAWQRAVADMQKAGVNPNLVNAAPAASGGGITSATGIDYTVYEKEMEKEIALLEQFIDNEFNASENQKDRLTDIISKLISFGGIYAATRKK